MNCPNCGAHVPEQRRLYRNKPVTATTRLRKRLYMRAKRLGVPFARYVQEHRALHRAGRRFDREVLSLPLPIVREQATDVRGRPALRGEIRS